MDRHRSRGAFGQLAPPAREQRLEPVVISDRYSTYGHPPEHRSLYWARLAREFRAAKARGGIDAVVGRWVLEVFEKVFAPGTAIPREN